MRRLRALQAENKRKAAAARLDEALWLDRDTLRRAIDHAVEAGVDPQKIEAARERLEQLSHIFFSHAGVAHQAMIIGEKTEVFISFRFDEAEREAYELHAQLRMLGVNAFVSIDLPGGVDLQEAIAEAMFDAKVHVMLGTETYGIKTNELYSTRQEMNYALTKGNPFLVRMCDEYKVAATSLAFEGRLYQPWKPGTPMPDDLADNIASKVFGAPVEHGPPIDYDELIEEVNEELQTLGWVTCVPPAGEQQSDDKISNAINHASCTVVVLSKAYVTRLYQFELHKTSVKEWVYLSSLNEKRRLIIPLVVERFAWPDRTVFPDEDAAWKGPISWLLPIARERGVFIHDVQDFQSWRREMSRLHDSLSLLVYGWKNAALDVNRLRHELGDIFDAIDHNKDGTLSPEEMKTALQDQSFRKRLNALRQNPEIGNLLPSPDSINTFFFAINDLPSLISRQRFVDYFSARLATGEALSKWRLQCAGPQEADNLAAEYPMVTMTIQGSLGSFDKATFKRQLANRLSEEVENMELQETADAHEIQTTCCKLRVCINDELSIRYSKAEIEADPTMITPEPLREHNAPLVEKRIVQSWSRQIRPIDVADVYMERGSVIMHIKMEVNLGLLAMALVEHGDPTLASLGVTGCKPHRCSTLMQIAEKGALGRLGGSQATAMQQSLSSRSSTTESDGPVDASEHSENAPLSAWPPLSLPSVPSRFTRRLRQGSVTRQLVAQQAKVPGVLVDIPVRTGGLTRWTSSLSNDGWRPITPYSSRPSLRTPSTPSSSATDMPIVAHPVVPALSFSPRRDPTPRPSFTPSSVGRLTPLWAEPHPSLLPEVCSPPRPPRSPRVYNSFLTSPNFSRRLNVDMKRKAHEDEEASLSEWLERHAPDQLGWLAIIR